MSDTAYSTEYANIYVEERLAHKAKAELDSMFPVKIGEHERRVMPLGVLHPAVQRSDLSPEQTK